MPRTVARWRLCLMLAALGVLGSTAGAHVPVAAVPPPMGTETASPGEVVEASALVRSAVDRADDVSGHQVHVMYVLPSDGVDRSLDTDGHLATSARAFNRWLATRTPGRNLRIDTYQGFVDITFFRMNRTDAQVRSGGEFGGPAYVRDIIEKDMKAAGFTKADTIYAAYYDGHSDFSCGGGAWPPTLPGTVGAMYLLGLPDSAVPCASPGLPGLNVNHPGYADFGMVHELLHTLGFVPTCAPHQQASGHVPEPDDLMYGGGTSPWDLSAPALDVSHDDYYEHSNAGCLDLDDSPFLKPSGAFGSTGDYDGDTSSDVAVYRPSAGVWYLRTPTPVSFAFGVSGDVPVPADYDGDGRTDAAVLRPSSMVWYLRTAAPGATPWGVADDIPVPGDYDGDGKAEVAVFRPSSGTWYLRSLTPAALPFGVAGDVPVPGDYDSDGKTDVAVYRRSTGVWYLGTTVRASFPFGLPEDIPVPGDYDGDGTTDAAVYRPSTGVWYLRTAPPASLAFGVPGDVPVPADYDGDGRTDLAVFRPSTGVWYLRTTIPTAVAWGSGTDRPLPLPEAIRRFITASS